MSPGSMKYAVLHGRRSGARSNASLVARTVATLRDAGHTVQELAAADLGEAHASAHAAVADGVDVLLVIGGDGVVRIAAQACAHSDTAIAIIPAGSGNDTARSLQIPTKHGAAIAVAATGHRRSVDLITARTDSAAAVPTYIVGSLPAALDARIAARSERVPSILGAARYAVATAAEIPRLRAVDYRLTIDGEVLDCSALVLTVCNLPIFGGGMRIAPAADPSDGLLDVVIIDTVGPLAASRLLRQVYAGTHAQHPAVRMVQCQSVRIQGPELLTYGDGDPIGPLPITCQVAPAALDVVVPI
ncbi:MAG: diacylglycerol kinase family protein [Ornithinimicrobium sp.]